MTIDRDNPDAALDALRAIPRRDGLQKIVQTSKWSCLPASFAMVMSQEPARRYEQLVKILGRDDERGFHVQELLGIALRLGWAFTPFEFEPELDRAACHECRDGNVEKQVNTFGDFAVFECEKCNGTELQGPAPLVLRLMKDIMGAHDGVLLGRRKGAPHLHAVAWCKLTQSCLDPEEGVYGIEGFEPITFWAGSTIGGSGAA